MSLVTEGFLHEFKSGVLVDVREKRRWSGPHRLLVYKLDPSRKDGKLAARMVVELGDGKKLERLLIVGDQEVIRKHIPEEQKQRLKT